MRINLINREALDLQLSVKQPSFWLVVGIFVALTGAERLIATILGTHSVVPRGGGYFFFRIAWLVTMLSIFTGISFLFSRRFPDALNIPPDTGRKRWLTEMALLLLAAPWLAEQLVYFMRLHGSILDTVAAAKGNASALHQLRETLIDIHAVLWTKMGYGIDFLGVILGSLKVLLFPIFEERFFRGYMLTRACQRYRPLVAIALVAFLFALMHLLVTHSVLQLGRMFLMGICCGLIRLQSGRWRDAFGLHLVINVFILLPYAYIAGIRFFALPRL